MYSSPSTNQDLLRAFKTADALFGGGMGYPITEMEDDMDFSTNTNTNRYPEYTHTRYGSPHADNPPPQFSLLKDLMQKSKVLPKSQIVGRYEDITHLTPIGEGVQTTYHSLQEKEKNIKQDVSPNIYNPTAPTTHNIIHNNAKKKKKKRKK